MKYYELISKLNKLQAKYDKLIKALTKYEIEIFDIVDFDTSLKLRDLIKKAERD